MSSRLFGAPSRPWMVVVVGFAVAFATLFLPRAEAAELATPDTSSVGVPAGVALVPSGSLRITEDGTTIDGLDVTGSITVAANDVTIRNTRINANGTWYAIRLASGVTGTSIESSELFGARSAAVNYGSYRAERLHVHSSRDGLLVGSHASVTDSYIHSLGHRGAGIKANGGQGSEIVGNQIVAAEGTALQLRSRRTSGLDDWLIRGNTFSGGRYTIEFHDRGGPVSNVIFEDNVFAAESWTRSAVWANAAAAGWSANVFDDGSPVSGPRIERPVISIPESTVPTTPTEPAPTVPEPTVSTPAPPEPTVTEPTVTEPTVPNPTVPTTPTVPEPTVPEPTVSTPPTPEPTQPTVPVTSPPQPGGPIDDQWRAVVASNDIEQIRSWYQQNTGFEAYYDEDRGRYLTEADLVPSGSITVTEDNTVLEGLLITGRIQIQADNVVIRASMIDVNGSYSYGIHAAGASAGDNWTVEYVTFANSAYERSQSHEDMGNRLMHTTTSGTARFNQSLDGYRAGFGIVNGYDQRWEYNYVDRIVTSPGSHNTSFSLRSQGSAVRDITVRRNLLLDGTSAALSFYPRTNEVNRNLLFEENVFDIYHDDRSVNYCVNRGSDHPNPGTTYRWQNVRWRGNIFGQSQDPLVQGPQAGQRRCGTSNYASGSGGDEFSGNRLMDGTPIG